MCTEKLQFLLVVSVSVCGLTYLFMGNEDGAAGNEEGRLKFMELMLLSTVPMTMKAIVNLGIPEIMAREAKDGVMCAEEIQRFMEDPNSDAKKLDRMLRLLASFGVFGEVAMEKEGRKQRFYGLNSVSKYLVKDAAGASLAPLLLLRHDPDFFLPMHFLHESVSSSTSPFERAHGRSFTQLLDKIPSHRDLFSSAMSNMSHIYITAILHQYKGFELVTSMVDIGGGNGSTLGLIVSQYPHIKAINFDLPNVVHHASVFPGVQNIGGDMFRSIPKANSMFMKNILHNWGDESCLKILGNCYNALNAERGKKIIMVEFLAPEIGDKSRSARVALSYDVVMMAQFHGKERSESEFRALFKAAGFSCFHIALRLESIAILEASI